jgi:hypothetical protein
MDPHDIDTRLAALEARAPGHEDPPELPRTAAAGSSPPGRPRGRAALVVLGGRGARVVATLAQATGVQGQPAPGRRTTRGTPPPEAAACLTAHGFTNVV